MKTHSKKIDATTWITTAFLAALIGSAYYIRQHHEPVESADSGSNSIGRTLSSNAQTQEVMAHRPSTPATISREN